MKYLLILLAITLLPVSSQAIEVVSLEVNLFYNESGSLSEDIVEAKDFILWNTIIGEGSAAEPSDRFLLKIKFSGPKDQYISDSVELKVSDKNTGKVVYTENYSGFLFTDQGFAYRASMVSGQNCKSLVIGVGNYKRNIEFHCGE